MSPDPAWPYPFGYAELPALPPRVPRGWGVVGRFVGRTVLRMLRFRVVGRFPDLPKMVAIGAPHTSNWDGVLGFAAILSVGLDMRVMIKDSIFRGPLGGLLRFVGGLPVNRKEPGGVVGQMVRRFETVDAFVLGIAPEGTRKKVTTWKTGFLRIAHEAGVPVLPITLDWGRREVFVGPPHYATDDPEADLAALQAFFARATGKNPTYQ